MDIWIDQRTYVGYLDFMSSSQQTGATDVRKAILANFPGGLADSKEQFSAKIAAAQQPSLESLGPILSLKDFPDGSSLAVYQVNLSSAHESIKVWPSYMRNSSWTEQDV